MAANIQSIACVVPPLWLDQRRAAELIREHYGERISHRGAAWMRACFSSPSIRKRHFAADDPMEIMEESPDRRVERFTRFGVRLASEAVSTALERAGVEPERVSCLVVNTCTGYICPGLSTYLPEHLGLSPAVRLFDLVGGGCAGALPNLELCEALLALHGEYVVSVSVEICSAAFQMENDLSLILSNALFGDGAAAVVLGRESGRVRLLASHGRHWPGEREAIRFVHRNGQLHNRLSTQLPELVRDAATETVAELLGRRGMTVGEVRHWALHTGGERILDMVGEGLGLSPDQLAPARRVLAEYGNLSSPTVWFVLEELLSRAEAGELCMMLTYGAGLAVHARLVEVG